MARFFTGMEGKAVVGSTTLDVRSWSAKETIKKYDTTNTGTGGSETFIKGTKSITGTVEAQWDAAKNWFASPPNINVGQTVALKLYLENSSGPYVDITTAFIESVEVTSSVEGVVGIKFEFQSTSTYAWPTTTF